MKKKAFTLIELVVVMAIIAVLAVVIIGAIVVARRASQVAANRANGQSVRTALETYYTKNKRYTVTAGTAWGPTTFSTLTGAGGTLAGYGVNLNTVGCANGGGDVTANADNQTYSIRIFNVPTCDNTDLAETITGP